MIWEILNKDRILSQGTESSPGAEILVFRMNFPLFGDRCSRLQARLIWNLLWDPGWPRTHGPPASVLGLQVWNHGQLGMTLGFIGPWEHAISHSVCGSFEGWGSGRPNSNPCVAVCTVLQPGTCTCPALVPFEDLSTGYSVTAIAPGIWVLQGILAWLPFYFHCLEWFWITMGE